MKKLLILVSLLFAFTLSACKDKPKSSPQTEKKIDIAPDVKIHKVIVIKKQDAGSYTYLNVSEKDKTYWIAATKMDAAKGDTLFYARSMEMKNFKSTALNKTFNSILFVDKISSTKQPKKVISHPRIKPETKSNITVKRHKGSISIKQLFSDSKSFAGKKIKVEGKVTKINKQIMNRNWIHIQDGTNYKGKYDLLITSNEIVSVGSFVIFEGIVATNKDFGAGYTYPILVEKAKLIKEIK